MAGEITPLILKMMISVAKHLHHPYKFLSYSSHRNDSGKSETSDYLKHCTEQINHFKYCLKSDFFRYIPEV